MVEEAIHASSYTYLRVTEDGNEYWIATAKQPIEKGMTVYYDQGLEMKKFTSKEIDRTFDSIWFVGKISSGSSTSGQRAGMSGSGSSRPLAQDKSISIEKASGSVSVQELYAGMSNYQGKTVSIRGKVTKFNTKIMGRNWVHLQDGTSEGNYIDVTITTNDVVKVDDVVIFTGKVTLNKDYGAGYKYDLIIEDAVLSAGS